MFEINCSSGWATCLAQLSLQWGNHTNDNGLLAQKVWSTIKSAGHELDNLGF